MEDRELLEIVYWYFLAPGEVCGEINRPPEHVANHPLYPSGVLKNTFKLAQAVEKKLGIDYTKGKVK